MGAFLSSRDFEFYEQDKPQTFNGLALLELYFGSRHDCGYTDYNAFNTPEIQTHHGSVNQKTLEQLFDDAWNSEPEHTLRFVFHLRDRHDGLGQRALFRALIRHMMDTGLTPTILNNIEYIPEFGYWKDLCACFFGTRLEYAAVNLFAKQLKLDLKSQKPSLCAKYAPSEGGALDRKYGAAKKIAMALGVPLSVYRKKYLQPLRARLDIVETHMCARNWRDIYYVRVPHTAHTIYKDAFKEHDREGYRVFIDYVRSGQINADRLNPMPYEIVIPYLRNSGYLPRVHNIIETQWLDYLSMYPANLNVLAIVDTSDSMHTRSAAVGSIEVGISLGLLFASLSRNPLFHKKFLTFSLAPELLEIQGQTLRDQVLCMANTKSDDTMSFQAVFDLILNVPAKSEVLPQDVPQTIVVFTHKQFAQAHDGLTRWREIDERFEARGLQRPKIVFWNVQDNVLDFPVPDATATDCVLLSGYNRKIVHMLLTGDVPYPAELVYEFLNDERYDCIHVS